LQAGWDTLSEQYGKGGLILNYFANLYRKPGNEPIDLENVIENFLGANIAGNLLVQNSKLTEAEKTELDLPLSLDELDKSLEKANFRSAPGLDGISNRFLRQYWQYFRVGIFRYANHCFNVGRLTDNFRGATIKLIPKKGNLSELKNLRPISLLSNIIKFYLEP